MSAYTVTEVANQLGWPSILVLAAVKHGLVDPARTDLGMRFTAADVQAMRVAS